LNELPAASLYLVRIPEIFSPFASALFERLGATPERALGKEYRLVRLADPARLSDSPAAKYLQWHLPVHHAWPCVPQKMEGFVEKAAQGIFRKFGEAAPQTILTGPLVAAAPHPYYRHLATNLRGRTLQLFPPMPAAGVDEQDPEAPTLFCLVGKEGLFCGLQSPRESNGFYPGGTKFIKQADDSVISRAGAKIAEALHYLRLHRPLPPKGAHWLELGASPGGMTSELLDRGYRVTAIDRAAMDKRLAGAEGLTVIRADVLNFSPSAGVKYDALLCDLNGDPRESIRSVARLARDLEPGGLVVFTLKLPNAESLEDCEALYQSVTAQAARSGLSLLAQTHLTYNRFELTLFFEAGAQDRA